MVKYHIYILSEHETVIPRNEGKELDATRWKSMSQYSGQSQSVNIKGLIMIHMTVDDMTCVVCRRVMRKGVFTGYAIR